MHLAIVRTVLGRLAALAVASAAIVAMSASPSLADQTFANPQVNGATVDNCAIWANNCGWGGAHQFCQTQGYAAARSFELNRPGRTWVIGSQRFCDGAGCVGFSQVVCMNAAALTGGDRAFDAPQVNGMAVDNCAVWGNDCGWGGAHQFCRTQGYAAAKSWSLYNPGRTWVIGSQRACEGGGCVGFSQVICTGGAGQPPTPPPPVTGGPLSGKWFGFSNNYYVQQNGNTFTWSAPGLNETAQGTINGTALSVTWTNGGGQGSATGTITAFDANGRATHIRWSNSIEWDRVD